jgi:hypothetical protein
LNTGGAFSTTDHKERNIGLQKKRKTTEYTEHTERRNKITEKEIN